MSTTNTEIPTLSGDARIPAYVARPEGAPRGAIIVHQEVFGVNRGIRKKTDDWAAKGYLAVAPDAFWRQQPDLDLDADNPEEFKVAIDFMMKHDFDQGIRDMEAVIHWIRREQGVAKVGFVGFCMGGRVAYAMATRTDIDASVGYYGVMTAYAHLTGQSVPPAIGTGFTVIDASNVDDEAIQKFIYSGE